MGASLPPSSDTGQDSPSTRQDSKPDLSLDASYSVKDNNNSAENLAAAIQSCSDAHENNIEGSAEAVSSLPSGVACGSFFETSSQIVPAHQADSDSSASITTSGALTATALRILPVRANRESIQRSIQAPETPRADNFPPRTSSKSVTFDLINNNIKPAEPNKTSICKFNWNPFKMAKGKKPLAIAIPTINGGNKKNEITPGPLTAIRNGIAQKAASKKTESKKKNSAAKTADVQASGVSPAAAQAINGASTTSPALDDADLAARARYYSQAPNIRPETRSFLMSLCKGRDANVGTASSDSGAIFPPSPIKKKLSGAAMEFHSMKQSGGSNGESTAALSDDNNPPIFGAFPPASAFPAPQYGPDGARQFEVAPLSSFYATPFGPPKGESPDFHNPTVAGYYQYEPTIAVMLAQFNNPTYSDVVLELQLPQGSFKFFLHSVVLSQSPSLAALLERSNEVKTLDVDGRIMIKLQPNIPGLSPGAFMDVLRTLYGTSPHEILAHALHSQTDAIHGDALLTQRVVLVTKFFVAGLFLGLDPVVDTALLSIKQELTWENLEFLMIFALSGAAKLSDHNPRDSKYTRKYLDGTLLGLGRSTYGSGTEALLLNCLDFIVDNFPETFFFDENASISYLLGAFELPCDGPASEAHPMKHLANSVYGVQFGSHTSITYTHGRLSTILLSAPFKIIAHVGERLIKKGNGFDMMGVLRVRNLRSLICMRAAALAKGIENVDTITMTDLPTGLPSCVSLPDRARWIENIIVSQEGVAELTRIWAGQSAAIRSPEKAASASPIKKTSTEVKVNGNRGAGGSGSFPPSQTKADRAFNWADDVSEEGCRG